jgi:hypothetical protein
MASFSKFPLMSHDSPASPDMDPAQDLRQDFSGWLDRWLESDDSDGESDDSDGEGDDSDDEFVHGDDFIFLEYGSKEPDPVQKPVVRLPPYTVEYYKRVPADNPSPKAVVYEVRRVRIVPYSNGVEETQLLQVSHQKEFSSENLRGFTSRT